MQAKLKPVEKTIDQSILVKNDKLNAFYAPHHYHPEYEIIYIKKSYGIKVIGNSIGNYQQGEVVILGPGLPHFHAVGNVNSEVEYPIETIAVLFPESIFETNLQFPEFAKANKVLQQIKYGIELTGTTKLEVQEVLETMSITPSLKNFLSLFKIIEIVMAEGSSYQQLSTVMYENKKIYNDKTKKILDFLATNFLNNIDVNEAANYIGLSKTGFCNFFKSQTGVTFSNYLNMLRISKTCELLATTTKSISEIAYETGYENLAYFNRRFKELKGTTPHQFRQEIKAK